MTELQRTLREADTRRALRDQLCARFKIAQGKRFVYSQNQAWYLTKYERVAARIIEHHVKPLKSCLITDIYSLRDLVVLYPSNNERRLVVKYLLVLLKSLNLVKVKCNNGYKAVSWNNERERRLRRLESAGSGR